MIHMKNQALFGFWRQRQNLKYYGLLKMNCGMLKLNDLSFLSDRVLIAHADQRFFIHGNYC